MIKWIGKLGRQVVDGYKGDDDTKSYEDVIIYVADKLGEDLEKAGCDPQIVEAIATGMVMTAIRLTPSAIMDQSVEEVLAWTAVVTDVYKEENPEWFDNDKENDYV